MSNYIEPAEALNESVRDYVRALVTMKEEIEAVTWYQQRVAVCSDDQLKRVLEHNLVEEIEHTCMALEWLRRNMPGWDEQLKTYLFKSDDIAGLESGEGGEDEGTDTASGLGLGSLKK